MQIVEHNFSYQLCAANFKAGKRVSGNKSGKNNRINGAHHSPGYGLEYRETRGLAPLIAHHQVHPKTFVKIIQGNFGKQLAKAYGQSLYVSSAANNEPGNHDGI